VLQKHGVWALTLRVPSSSGVFEIVATNYGNMDYNYCMPHYTLRYPDPQQPGLYKDENVTLPPIPLKKGARQVVGNFDSRVHPGSFMMDAFVDCR
jgi:hypothetical protein